jgi:hypothetical protein
MIYSRDPEAGPGMSQQQALVTMDVLDLLEGNPNENYY